MRWPVMRRLSHEEMGDPSKVTWPGRVRSDESHALSTKANFSELWRLKSQGMQNLSAWRVPTETPQP